MKNQILVAGRQSYNSPIRNNTIINYASKTFQAYLPSLILKLNVIFYNRINMTKNVASSKLRRATDLR